MLCFHSSLIEIVPSVQTTLHAFGTLYFQFEPFSIAFHCAIVPLKAMLVRLVQCAKAPSPMLVTPSGIVMFVSPVQPQKASLPILVPLVILTAKEVGFACFATVLTFVAEPEMLVRPLQSEKASFPMLVTPSGIVMLVSPLQPAKAQLLILVTPLPIVTLVSPVQSRKA